MGCLRYEPARISCINCAFQCERVNVSRKALHLQRKIDLALRPRSVECTGPSPIYAE